MKAWFKGMTRKGSHFGYLVIMLLALFANWLCFGLAYFVELMPLKLVFFLVGVAAILGFFIFLAHLIDSLLPWEKPSILFNIAMLVISATFSLMYYASPEIIGYDMDKHDLLSAALLFLVAFVAVVVCSILLYRELRAYASSLYTSAFTASFACLSALLYLFGDLLPAGEPLEIIKLITVVSSLSLALSLFLVELSKRKESLPSTHS